MPAFKRLPNNARHRLGLALISTASTCRRTKAGPETDPLPARAGRSAASHQTRPHGPALLLGPGIASDRTAPLRHPGSWSSTGLRNAGATRHASPDGIRWSTNLPVPSPQRASVQSAGRQRRTSRSQIFAAPAIRSALSRLPAEAPRLTDAGPH
jgi:hypothetical protein